METTKEYSTHPRFKVGKEAGVFDRAEEIESDMEFYITPTERLLDADFINYKWKNGDIVVQSFAEFDPAYVAGYQEGYKQGPKRKK